MSIHILSPEVSAQIAAGEVVVEDNLKRAERLRQAIPQRAFQGRLVPQDPTDEPASALLEQTHQAVGAQFIAPRSPGAAPRSPGAAPRSPGAAPRSPGVAPREGAGVMNHAPTGGKTRRGRRLV